LEEKLMKKIVAAVALTLAFAVSAMAADTVVFPASMGNVTFNHKAHQEKLKDCKLCHGDGAPAKIVINKAVAHDVLCKVCHAKSNVGADQKCKFCHKK
jgi:opacity protein-like surface antigen